MKNLMICVVVTSVCLSVLVAAGASPKKERDWREGKLIDISSEQTTGATFTYGMGRIALGDRITYVIDDGKYLYFASHTHFKNDDAMAVTVNTIVKFAIEKNKVYLKDEKDKEHELEFVKRTLKS